MIIRILLLLIISLKVRPQADDVPLGGKCYFTHVASEAERLTFQPPVV